MPLYDYKCATCGAKREVMLKLADISSPVFCVKDGFAMNKQVSAPYIVGDYEPYESPVIPGKWIMGRRQHEEHLRETGCRILEPGETERQKKRLAKADEDFDKAIEATADELITTLPSDKKERLAAEMDAGLTTQYERLAA